MSALEDRTVAMAGILQACSLVQSLARTGEADEAVQKASIGSILVLDAVNSTSIFGGNRGIRLGLQLLAEGRINSMREEDVELIRYAMTILQLQVKLFKQADAYARFAQRVELLSALDAADLDPACSEIYKEYISVLRPQVIVQGEPEYLQQTSVADQIRALLLAAIRAATLWQQKGGGKFRLIMERSRMQAIASELLPLSDHLH